MSEYVAPLKDVRFALRDLAGMEQVATLPGCEEASPDLVDAILEEAARFAGEVLSPLNRVGDTVGAKWKDKEVTTAPGFKEAYAQFVENGWNGLSCDPEFGGQGLPKLLSAAVSEMWKSANHAFSLCPMLTQGAIEALIIAGSDEQKATYLPKLVSGEWTGTMNLTEPNAGSDLAAVRTRAEPVGDGTYKIFGQKIFITYGEHDMADNIVHLVLARTPDAPEGVKGISLFVVPKFLVKADGSLGERNDAYCVSIEHKLGIHGSPTAVLAFGDNGGAIGTLVGEENRGLEYMFIMMNAARFNVGLEGLGDAERAYQRAVAYARERIQGPEAGVKGGPKVAIIRHPDVRRMLMSMRSQVEAMRALAYVTAAALDNAHSNPDETEQKKAQAFADLMIPVVKGWSTENSILIASTGVQVHGGMGFIEET
ncbi:MAG TPA: acyl-CoA dehydrogenase family protein, partial [Rhodocyclaceae bacterium]|nr:acyl-CoA dehydrogenase family protein [Rhodocyclaceae bacterium]